MEDRCFGRIISWSNSSIARFSKCAKSRFYLESRCQNKSIHDQLCQSCLEKKGQKASEPRKNLYGLVTDPLPVDCRIFGSEWYESKVKELGQPSESDMARAKKAQEEARKDTVVVAQPVVVKTEAKKRGRKPKQEPAPVPTPPPPPQPNPNPNPSPSPPPNPNPHPAPKPAKRRAKTNIPQKTEKVQVQAIEASSPLTDIEVVKIIVKPFRHNDVDYFRDAKKNKLYASGKDKRPSQYVGRWNPETETIDHEFPDSDVE